MKKSKKVIKINTSIIKKIKYMGLFFVLILFLLIFRIAYLQLIKGPYLKKEASTQQTSTKIINATRGTIYDSNGKVLAISAESDTISVNPSKLKYSNGEAVSLEFVAQSFSNILGIEYSEVYKKLTSDSTSITIASKVESDKIDLLRTWMNSNKITSGINIDSSSKRYYPYNNLACHVIGFTGTDNNGLFGLENSLDSLLSGTAGKVVTLTDSINQEIPNQKKSSIDALNGSNVYLTLDVNIQSIAEKYLSQAVVDNVADYGTVIIMEPSTRQCFGYGKLS